MPEEIQARLHPDWLNEVEWKKAKHDVAETIGCLKNCLEFGTQKQMSAQDICDEFKELIPKLEVVYEKLFLEKKS